jgi:hypothetical protein
MEEAEGVESTDLGNDGRVRPIKDPEDISGREYGEKRIHL